MPDPKLYTYRHTNCFVRDGERRVQAVAVIRTTSAAKAAEAFGTSTDDLRKFGGRWKPGVLGRGAGDPAGAEFTLDGGVTWWRSSLDSELERHPDVLYWRPVGSARAGEPERWFVGVDGAAGATAPVRNLVAEAERAFMTILAHAYGAFVTRGHGLTVTECDRAHGHDDWKMARVKLDVSLGPAAVEALTAFAASLPVKP